jgi:maltose O-acetyltransferase
MPTESEKTPAGESYDPMNSRKRRNRTFGRTVAIGSDVWIGGGAMNCPGVRIGSRTAVGAGRVVTRDIPEGVFAAGNPCRVVRDITGSRPRPNARKAAQILGTEFADGL